MSNPVSIKVRLIDGPSSANRIFDRSARDSILRKMGAALKLDTVSNFGITGTDRPSPWKPLSKRYAKRVGRTHATLDLTGALMRSLRVGQPDGDSITVSTDDPKAAYHQNGEGNNPLRPFFPLLPSGQLTPRAMRRVETAAQLETQRILRAQIK